MELRLATVSEFFQEALTQAMKNQGLDSTAPTECYLVNLLSDYARTPIDDEALALKLANATFAPPDERVRHLREVADTSLYISGFFSDSLQRKLVDVDYYIQIGGTAYGQLASHYRGRKQAAIFGEVYEELGQKFPRFVDVLAEVSESSQMTNNTGLVQLYERWLRTGSEWIERRLRERGMLPGKGDTH